jgi:N utilization substance protein A
MDKNQLLQTIRLVCEEKGITIESVQETIEAALAAAYRKDYGEKLQNIVVDFDLSTGDSRVFDSKMVVEDVPAELLEEAEEGENITLETDEEGEVIKRFSPKTDIQISDAKKLGTYKVGDEIRTELPIAEDYGRMAAQTAKQVIIQKLREAERGLHFDTFKAREKELIVGTVQRRESRYVLVDLGNVSAIMPRDEQIYGEHYIPGARLRVYLKSVEQTTKGPEIVASRSDEGFLEQLFLAEIPEIAAGDVEIMGIAREAGSRAKVAVRTLDDSIDPVGACVGQRGARIQTIINELSGEKVDIIIWKESMEEYIRQALSPAEIDRIVLDEEEQKADVYVNDDQLSLAIGKSGQNVRLAVKLTGWDLNIIKDGQAPEVKAEEVEEPAAEQVTEEAAEVESSEE